MVVSDAGTFPSLKQFIKLVPYGKVIDGLIVHMLEGSQAGSAGMQNKNHIRKSCLPLFRFLKRIE